METSDLPEGFKLLVGALCGGLAQILGGWDLPLYLLMLANVSDVVFGIAAGTKTEGFVPRKLAAGTAIKVGYWGVIVVAFAVDQMLSYYGLDTKLLIHEAAVVSFFVADSVSALANAAICGVPVPPVIMTNLARLKMLIGEAQPEGKNG